MKNIDEMAYKLTTSAQAKKFWRSYDLQDYRNQIVRNYYEWKKEWKTNKELRDILLKEQWTVKYVSSLEWDRKVWNDVAKQLLKDGEYYFVAKNLNKFTWLDKEVAKILLEHKYTFEVVKNLDRFTWLDKKIALKLINDGQTWARQMWFITLESCWVSYWKYVAQNFESFEWLDKEVLDALFKVADYKHDKKDIGRYDWLYSEIKDIYFNGFDEDLIMSNLDKVKWLNFTTLAEDWIKEGKGYIVAKYINKFNWVDNQRIAQMLIEKECVSYIVRNLEKFQWLDYGKIIDACFAEWCWYLVAEYINKFEWVDNQKIAERLLKSGDHEYLLRYLKKFKELDKKIAYKLVELWDTDYRINGILVRGSKYGEGIANNIKSFKKSDHKEIADMLIRGWYSGSVVDNIKDFEWLDENIAKLLMKKWYWKYVERYPEKFWIKSSYFM